MGDELAIHVLDSLGSKAKALKLVRNKLTDNFLRTMAKKMRNICTLNLAQNQLTDRSIDLIYESLKNKELPQLKSIVLSQNKIIERKVKERVGRFKEMGVIVSL